MPASKVSMLEVVEVVQEVVVVLEVAVLEVVQLLEDDVVRLEVEHPEVVQCPPPLEVVACVSLWLRCSASGDC